MERMQRRLLKLAGWVETEKGLLLWPDHKEGISRPTSLESAWKAYDSRFRAVRYA